MKLLSLRLDHWRNYREAALEFDPQLNVICGNNAQGKTNLIEAVSYLGLASSFRGAAETELISHEADYFFIQAVLERKDAGGEQRQITVSAAADRNKKRKWNVDGEPRQKLADVVGICHSVIFSPEDIGLVKNGPDRRRRWLNHQLAQTDAAYCRAMIRYNQVLRQRNACLRLWFRQPQEELLAVWDQQLAQLAAVITRRRALAMQRIAPLTAAVHSELAGDEQVLLDYRSQLLEQGSDSIPTEEELAQRLLERLPALRERELNRAATLIGPHRDEIRIDLNGMPARDFASQGQQRTLAVSMKLAELEWAKEQIGEYPILLLDDVLSELDEARRERILALHKKAQTFLTVAGRSSVPENSGSLWLVEAPQLYACIRKISR